jgi:hypothetical protein
MSDDQLYSMHVSGGHPQERCPFFTDKRHRFFAGRCSGCGLGELVVRPIMGGWWTRHPDYPKLVAAFKGSTRSPEHLAFLAVTALHDPPTDPTCEHAVPSGLACRRCQLDATADQPNTGEVKPCPRLAYHKYTEYCAVCDNTERVYISAVSGAVTPPADTGKPSMNDDFFIHGFSDSTGEYINVELAADDQLLAALCIRILATLPHRIEGIEADYEVFIDTPMMVTADEWRAVSRAVTPPE